MSLARILYNIEENPSPPQTEELPQLDRSNRCIHDQNKLNTNKVKYRPKWAI